MHFSIPIELLSIDINQHHYDISMHAHIIWKHNRIAAKHTKKILNTTKNEKPNKPVIQWRSFIGAKGGLGPPWQMKIPTT